MTLGKDKGNRDGFKLQINNIIKNYSKITINEFFTIEFEMIDEKEICIIKITPSSDPIFIKDLQGNDVFYVRSGNQSSSLNPKETLDYVKQHWPNFFIDVSNEREKSLDIHLDNDIDPIFKDFTSWYQDLLAKHMVSKVQDANPNELKKLEFNDFLFICIIPSTYSDNLIDFSADGINDTKSSKMSHGTTITLPNPEHYPLIEHYFRDFFILQDSQVYSTQKYRNYSRMGLFIYVFHTHDFVG